MKILWVNTNFMHPTTKGGVIRTLEMLRHLHRRHEIHFAAIERPDQPEGPARAPEYSTRHYSVKETPPERGSLAFAAQVASGVFSSLPLAVSRFRSERLARLLDDVMQREKFDRVVCDHLAPASYVPHLDDAFLFQHNVETIIWRRHVQHATDPLRRAYFAMQARKMFRFERDVCRTARYVIAVSDIDAENMRAEFGVSRISAIPTGVNIEYHAPPPDVKPYADLAFVGSMDWLANVDGVTWFVSDVLPLIRQRRPDCTFAIIGRSPPPAIRQMAADDPKIFVTGTVPDIRPYLWGSAVSVVPLRIGGGTRLKIYESMASRVPVVSTRVGAEGLLLEPPDMGRLADSPQEFADACLELLANPGERKRVADCAWQMVNDKFSWDEVARSFEDILEKH